ncbi:hypothetical protein [Nocardioides sp.]|uniref:hypothetical protein n=1 Tax=Nocardioides sp. TaxID=35761 RepID=UPI003564ADF1
MGSGIRRGVAPWVGVVLVSALMPLVGPASPAGAADPVCSSEVPKPLPPSACDDATPPETSLEPLVPSPNAAGWTRTDAVTLTFAVVETDPNDTDEMRLECKLEGPSQAHDWQDCTSPRSYTGLTDTTDGSRYTFTVRAYDRSDRAIVYDNPQTPPPPFGTPDYDTPDEDATPESVSWRQDTVVPHAYVVGGPYDPNGSSSPVTEQPKATFRLTASEPDVTYDCSLNGFAVPCKEGKVPLRKLSGGDKVFTVLATDQAGNQDPSLAVKQFTVPFNLKGGRGWTQLNRKGAFKGDQLVTRTRGARVKFKASDVRGVRLIAPSGPALGKLRVRVGRSYWTYINLRSGTSRLRREYVIRGPRSVVTSGQIVIESLSNRRAVKVDALVFPPD